MVKPNRYRPVNPQDPGSSPRRGARIHKACSDAGLFVSVRNFHVSRPGNSQSKTASGPSTGCRDSGTNGLIFQFPAERRRFLLLPPYFQRGTYLTCLDYGTAESITIFKPLVPGLTAPDNPCRSPGCAAGVPDRETRATTTT